MNRVSLIMHCSMLYGVHWCYDFQAQSPTASTGNGPSKPSRFKTILTAKKTLRGGCQEES